MPLDSTAECAEPRGGLKTVSKLCVLSVLRGDKSLDFQTVLSCSKIFNLTRLFCDCPLTHRFPVLQSRLFRFFLPVPDICPVDREKKAVQGRSDDDAHRTDHKERRSKR